MWLKEEEENPPPPEFEPRVRKLFMLDNCIHCCQPAAEPLRFLFYKIEGTAEDTEKKIYSS